MDLDETYTDTLLGGGGGGGGGELIRFVTLTLFPRSPELTEG